MTDPTVETREALETWADEMLFQAMDMCEDPAFTIAEIDELRAQIARVKVAHAHLLKGQDDGNKA